MPWFTLLVEHAGQASWGTCGFAMSIFVFWGKSTRGSRWHPAVCHMVDVGQVARVLLEEVLPEGAKRLLAAVLGITVSEVPAWGGLLCALHDLGKVSPGFQKKVPPLFHIVKESGFTSSLTDEGNHGAVTFAAVGPALRRRGFPLDVADAVAQALGGHHGMFPPLHHKGLGKGPWETAREEVVEALGEVFGVRWTTATPTGTPPPPEGLMILAGLASVSDWLGSDTRFFEAPDLPVTDLKTYAAEAGDKAARAVRAIGWGRLNPNKVLPDFGDLFFDVKADGTRQPWLANPIQGACGDLARGAERPSLLLVEAPMGTGKTEAALWAADSISARLHQAGLYYALPTQATSNQMLIRLVDYLKARYPADVVQLNLLHGMADFNEVFQELRARSDGLLDAPIQPADVGDETGAVVAQEWFCGHKRGLLSPFAVGTVDQALLGVLTARHFFVRLFGLAHKTVVIDEVHAYDTYMSTLLERLLQWFAKLGTSVILLSATLPSARRRALVQAYTGRLLAEDVGTYPRVVSASGEDIHVASFPVETGQLTQVAVAGCAEDSVPTLLAEKLSGGGCAAWICNTVSRAQAAYEALAHDPRFADADLTLFHARFPLADRLARERQVLGKFGKRGARPRKAAVVATQVIEQSLDLDFDLLVTDLAPVDLVLQRAGRLHRHRGRSRPQALSCPEVFWTRPSMGADGVPAFGPSAWVYDEYILLRSWLLLRNQTSITIPSDIEAWIEAVYGPDVGDARLEPALRCALETLRQRSEDRREQEAAKARDFILPRPDASDGVMAAIEFSPPDDDETAQRLTRLSAPTVMIICAHETSVGPSLTPDGTEAFAPDTRPNRSLVARLFQRSVRIGSRFWYRHFIGLPCPSGWRDVPLLRSCRLACFRDGEVRVGNRTLRLDPILGLVDA